MQNTAVHFVIEDLMWSADGFLFGVLEKKEHSMTLKFCETVNLGFGICFFRSCFSDQSALSGSCAAEVFSAAPSQIF